MLKGIKKVLNQWFGLAPYRVNSFESVFKCSVSPVNLAEREVFILEIEKASLIHYHSFKSLFNQQFSSINSSYSVYNQRSKERFQNGGFFLDPAKKLFSISQGCIFGTSGIIYDSETRTIIEESARDWFLPLQSLPLTRAFRLKKPEYIDKIGLSICSEGSNGGYYHFMHESLPRLQIAKQILDDVDYVIIPTPAVLSWKLTWLQQCGIPESKVFWIEPNGHFQFKQLFFTSLPISDHKPAPDSVNALRQLSGFKISTSVKGKRIIWPSRKGADIRSFGWEEQIRINYPEIDFVDFASLSPEETMQICSEAVAFIGPHGGAFSNLIFCGKGTLVIELFPDLVWHALYHRLSCACDLDHYILHVDFENPKALNGFSILEKAIQFIHEKTSTFY